MTLTAIPLPPAAPDALDELRTIAGRALAAGQLGPACFACWQLHCHAPEDPKTTDLLDTLGRDPRFGAISYRQITPMVQQLNREGNYAGVMMSLALPLLRDCGDVFAAVGLAEAAVRVGRHDLALHAIWPAYQRHPEDPRLVQALAGALHENGMDAEAAQVLADLVALRPGQPGPRAMLGAALARAGNTDAAIAVTLEALAAFPDDPELLVNLGAMTKRHASAAMQEQGLAALDAAVAADPAAKTAHLARAAALVYLQRFPEAREATARALALDPGDHELRAALANLDLSLGDFEAGFAAYPARFDFQPWLRWLVSAAPVYTGQPLDGKTLLVWGDQGVGEQVLFSPALEILQNQPGAVIFLTDPRLVGPFQRRFPDIRVLPRNDSAPLPDHDLSIALGDLFGRVWAELRCLPADTLQPLLPPLVERSVELRATFPADRPLVGISWRGGLDKDAPMRSMTLAELVAGLPSDRAITLVDLQYDTAAGELAGVGDSRLVASGIDNRDDLESLLALMAACDAVVSVDNANAHFAAAVGTPTHVLVPAPNPAFRWKNAAIRAQVFPAARATVQARPDDWTSALAAVWTAVIQDLEEP